MEQWAIRSQAPEPEGGGEGSETRWVWVMRLSRMCGLRYSPPPQKWEPRPKPPRGPEVEGRLHAKLSEREPGYGNGRHRISVPQG